MTFWIDTHCHLDAAEFLPDVASVRARAASQGVAHCVLPAVSASNFAAVRCWHMNFQTATRWAFTRCACRLRKRQICKRWTPN